MPQKLECEVTRVLDHGGQVYSVSLKPESMAPRFLPGQFLHLALDPYKPGDFWPESRPFSIASSPSKRESLCITYSVKGHFTGRMETELRVGRQVWVKLPYGEFVVNVDSEACLLAGGTGVAAFTAFLSTLPARLPHPVYLFYGARRPDLLIYHNLVQAAAERCPSLQVHFLAEHDADGTDCLHGRLDLDVVLGLVPAPAGLTYYLSGPPEMLRALAEGLAGHDIPRPHIMTDAWE